MTQTVTATHTTMITRLVENGDDLGGGVIELGVKVLVSKSNDSSSVQGAIVNVT